MEDGKRTFARSRGLTREEASIYDLTRLIAVLLTRQGVNRVDITGREIIEADSYSVQFVHEQNCTTILVSTTPADVNRGIFGRRG